MAHTMERLPFSDRYDTAHRDAVYDKTTLVKMSPEHMINFHTLLYMEIQYLASCCTRWRTVGGNEKSGGGSKANEDGGGGGSKANDDGGGGGSD